MSLSAGCHFLYPNPRECDDTALASTSQSRTLSSGDCSCEPPGQLDTPTFCPFGGLALPGKGAVHLRLWLQCAKHLHSVGPSRMIEFCVDARTDFLACFFNGLLVFLVVWFGFIFVCFISLFFSACCNPKVLHD